ncbi:MAG: glycosyltransferase family 4 protein [Deltaproteobacteria bacterium]|nr:glycosyltransferase family 4 protein [Deltaproteobacteria bacterium]
MKILILTFYYKPDLCAGSFRSAAFINALRPLLKKKDSVDVITTMPNRYKTFRKEAASVEVKGNINIVRIQLPPHKSGFFDQIRAFFTYFIKTVKYTKKRDYDVVFATSSRLFTAFLGAVISKMKGALLYLDIRDIFTDTMKSLLYPPISWMALPIFFLVERFTVLKADKVNLVSEGFRGYFENIAPEKKFSFFTNGIDEEFIDVSFDKKNSTEKKIITYAGNIGQGQGLEKIIPYIAKMTENENEFWIIGDGGMRSVLEDNLKKQGVINVVLFNPVGREDLIKFYKQSNYLFLHLNDCAAFEKVLPSKIFEYAAITKPIIAGVSGFARKFISDNIKNATVFKPCDHEDFLSKFRSLSTEEQNREEFVKQYNSSVIMRQMAQDFIDINDL